MRLKQQVDPKIAIAIAVVVVIVVGGFVFMRISRAGRLNHFSGKSLDPGEVS